MVIECRPSTNSVNYICGLIALLTQCFIKIEGSIVRLLTVVKHSADLAMCSIGQICGRNVIRNIQVARFCTVVVFFFCCCCCCFVLSLPLLGSVRRTTVSDLSRASSSFFGQSSIQRKCLEEGTYWNH